MIIKACWPASLDSRQRQRRPYFCSVYIYCNHCYGGMKLCYPLFEFEMHMIVAPRGNLLLPEGDETPQTYQPTSASRPFMLTPPPNAGIATSTRLTIYQPSCVAAGSWPARNCALRLPMLTWEGQLRLPRHTQCLARCWRR